jgi:hypothetical protein
MKALDSGDLEFGAIQRRLLAALLARPMTTADVVARGAALAALHLRAENLVEWVYPGGWRLTPAGEALAERITAGRMKKAPTGERGRGGTSFGDTADAGGHAMG